MSDIDIIGFRIYLMALTPDDRIPPPPEETKATTKAVAEKMPGSGKHRR